MNACHLADAQSDLLLFLRNPTRFPIWDEKLVPSTTHQDSPFNPLYRGENRIPNSLSLLPLTIPLCVRIFAVSNQRRRLKKLSLLLLKSNDESFQISYQDLELPGVNYSRVWKFCDTCKYSHRIGNLLKMNKNRQENALLNSRSSVEEAEDRLFKEITFFCTEKSQGKG